MEIDAMNEMEDINGEEIYQIMKEICDFGFRRAGTPNAIDAEKYIYEKFKEVGLSDTKLEEFKFPRWWAEKHELTILAEGTPLVPLDQTIETFPVYLSGYTAPEGINADVVYVGPGTSVEFEKIQVKDKIVLIKGKMLLNFFPSYHEMLFNSLNLAKKNGALAAICINGSPLDSLSYTSFDTIYGWKRRIPALSVNNFDGKYLKSLCKENKGKLKVKFVLNVKSEKATSNFVINTLPGKNDDVILVGTHTDSTFTGAVDNAGANARLIALAKHFAQIPQEKREKTIVFVGWTGHEAGLIGVDKFVKMHQEMLKNITTFIMLDGFGSKGFYNQADGGVIETGLDEIRGLFISDNPVLIPIVMEAVTKHKLLPAAYVSAKSLPVSDLPPFIFSNIPSIMIIGKPIWYHTKYDTIDKCTPDQLERSAKAHAQIIEKILKIPSQEIKDADGKFEDVRAFIKKKSGLTPPSGSFTVIPHPIEEDFPAFFYPTVINAPESIVMDFKWSFGDGETSSIILTRHAYKKAGTYEVSFKVVDNYGNESIAKQIIRVIKK